MFINYSLIGAVALPVVGGYLSGIRNREAIDYWYKDIKKPWYTPPNYSYPIIWTSLFVSMGYASYLVSQAKVSYVPLASVVSIGSLASFLTQPYFGLFYYGVQLSMNFAYGPIFFWYRKLKLAFFTCSSLACLLVPTTVSFWRANKTAGKLMVPYFVWVSIASVVTYRVWKDNEGGRFKKVQNRWRFEMN